MALQIQEQNGLTGFSIKSIEDKLEPWEKGDAVTRKAVARALHECFSDSLITTGGHHVAAHNPMAGDRMLVIISDAPDFS